MVLVLFAALGVVVWAGSEWTRDANPPGEIQVETLAIPDVHTVVVHDTPSWRLERGDRGWTVSEGGDHWAADPGQALGLVDALVEATVGVPLADVDPAALGLDEPIRVEVGGRGVWRLEVGDDAPVGGRTWIRVEGIGVLAVRGGVGEAIRAGPRALIDRSLWRGEAPDRVMLEGPTGRWVAQRQGGTWAGDPPAPSVDVGAWAQRWVDVQIERLQTQAADAPYTLTLHSGDRVVVVRLGATESGWRAAVDDGRGGTLDEDVGGWVQGFVHP